MSTNIASPQNSGRQTKDSADIKDGTSTSSGLYSCWTTVDRKSSTGTRAINHTPSTEPGKQAGVHPSAVGSGTTPNMSSSSDNNANGDTTTDSDTMPGADEGYPEQKHAGKVGYGPNYNQGTGFLDKVVGLKEEFKGKVTKNHELAEHGRDRRTGELKHKEMENDDDDPFATPEEKKKPPLEDAHKSSSSSTPAQEKERGSKEEAATVSPEGTDEGEVQRKGEAVENMKNIG